MHTAKTYIKYKETKLNPWITNGILLSLNHRDKHSHEVCKEPEKLDYKAEYSNNER